MSNQVNTTAQVTFQSNAEIMLQQRKARIASVLRRTNVSGEKALIKDFFGSVATQTKTDRHGDTKFANTPHDRLWLVKPNEDYVADLIDRHDQMVASVELGSNYMVAQVDAINRYWDDQALAAIYGNIISGKEGTTVSPLAGGMTVPVTTGGASGAQRFNTRKLRAANKLLAQKYNDMQMKKFIVLCAEQLDDLLDEVPATSEDFKQLGGQIDPESGYHTRLLGWNLIPMELGNPLLKQSVNTLDGSGYRRNPFWIEDGIVIGEWEHLYTRVSERDDKHYSNQVYAASCVAATRTQDGKVGIILNSEA